MLSLALWLLATPSVLAAAQPTGERWELSIDLVRDVDVGGVGLLEAKSRSVFILRGPLSGAAVERCSLEIESALASASATHFVDPRVPLVFREQGATLFVDDGTALMPTGPVRFELRAGGLVLHGMTVEVGGRLTLVGRRDGSGMGGAVTIDDPKDRVEGPAFVRIALSSHDALRGTFSLSPTTVASCRELNQTRTAVEGR